MNKFLFRRVLFERGLYHEIYKEYIKISTFHKILLIVPPINNFVQQVPFAICFQRKVN